MGAIQVRLTRRAEARAPASPLFWSLPGLKFITSIFGCSHWPRERRRRELGVVSGATRRCILNDTSMADMRAQDKSAVFANLAGLEVDERITETG